jgi:Hydrazine synthase alpha subunit middle domain
MVVGAPTNATDTTVFYWQLYEITNLAAVVANSNTVPALVKIPNQPANYNNVMACYGTDGRIIFSCDRTRNGQRHLYPQLDEYNSIPTNTGLWSFDPLTGDLIQLDHSPSGSFHPLIDSFGRVIFTRWDHLVVDRAATDDRMGRATNGAFNFVSEAVTNYDISNVSVETFPEPRSYDSNLLAVLKVQGQVLNSFFPWMINEDGTGAEFVNHIGRHELLPSFRGSSFTNDPNLRQQFALAGTGRTNFLNNFMHIHEDPTNPGSYFGIDGPDFGMHAAGKIVTLYGPPSLDAEKMFITYITPSGTDFPNAFGSYRNPLPMSDGTLVAAYTLAPSLDSNVGTVAAPKSLFNFRLMKLTKSGATYTTNAYLTAGLTNPVGYYVGAQLVTNNSALWELQPVEIIVRSAPTNHSSASVAAIEAKVFAEEGVPIPEFQTWLRTNDLALLISRNVTARDRADREQPFNLRVPGGVQTLATNLAVGSTNSGKIYDITYIQFLQADQLRGVTLGTTNAAPGRRVLAMPMHEFAATNFNVPNTNNLVGATRLGLDGSQATLVPARRAMTHQTVDNAGQQAVRERYWLTYQPGEIRTCAVCHGLNTADQANRPLPTNSPAALRTLLRHWKDQLGYARIISGGPTNGGFRVDVSGGTKRTNVLEAASDLGQNAWTPILTNGGSTNGLYWLLDSSTQSQRFYRIAVP